MEQTAVYAQDLKWQRRFGELFRDMTRIAEASQVCGLPFSCPIVRLF